MKNFLPPTGSIDEWNAAYYRLEDYLRAHRVINKVYQSQIILQLLRRAAVRHALDSSQCPTTLALEEAYAEIEQWFRLVLPDPETPPSRLCIEGKVSMYVVDAAARWPNVFLSEDEIPDEFRSAMQQATVQDGPDLRISSMVPRPLDTNTVAELIEETWDKLEKWAFGFLLGFGILFVCGVVWFLKR